MGTNEVTPLWQIQRDVHAQFLKWQRMRYFLELGETQYAYRIASENEKAAFQIIVNNGDVHKAKLWVEKQKQQSIRYWSHRKLRERGQLLGIPRWSRLDRDELISAIMEHETNARGAQSDSDTDGRHHTPFRAGKHPPTGIRNAHRRSDTDQTTGTD